MYDPRGGTGGYPMGPAGGGTPNSIYPGGTPNSVYPGGTPEDGGLYLTSTPPVNAGVEASNMGTKYGATSTVEAASSPSAYRFLLLVEGTLAMRKSWPVGRLFGARSLSACR